jgi:hypothetical protein
MQGESMDLDDAWLDMGLEEVARDLPLAAARTPRMTPLVPAAVLAVGLAVVALAVWRPQQMGKAQPAPAAEAASADLHATMHVEVDGLRAPRSLDVLFVDGAARWSYRYARNALLRAEGVRLQTFLLEAAPEFVHEHSHGVPALRRLPAPRDLSRYRVVLLGDVSPRALLAAGRDPIEFARAIAAYVARGGGLGVVCGERGMPLAWQGSALAEVLPVIAAADVAPASEPWRLEVTEIGTRHPLLRTGAGDTFDPAAWTSAGAVVHRALAAAPRPGADVLLRARTAPERLLLVAGACGRGRVVLAGTDELWRLRGADQATHQRLVVNVVRWLAGG